MTLNEKGKAKETQVTTTTAPIINNITNTDHATSNQTFNTTSIGNSKTSNIFGNTKIPYTQIIV